MNNNVKMWSMARRCVLAATGVLLIVGAAYTVWAYYAPHNRPFPLMDYVPQEIGIYDTPYWELAELDCRGCHGNSLADRHHLAGTGLCTPCHEVTDAPPYVFVIRDCLTSGCHSWDDVDTNGWHHNSYLSGSDNCVACHDPNLIEEITPVRDLETYPPTVTTPTPFSCENCHWGQDLVPGGNPDSPGHPSTFDHYASDQFVGFYEYSKPIYGSMDTHHMGFKGNVSDRCYECHSANPNNPDWDPFNPELIRYCEVCHSVETLHAIPGHVGDMNGWEAIGFHVPFSNTQTRDVDPIVYRTWDPTGPYAPETTDGFTTDQMCLGCHGDALPDPPPVDQCTGNAPAIDTTDIGMQPKYGTCGTIVTLRGQNFGEEPTEGRKVQMKLKGTGNPWADLPVASWTDTLIEFTISCGSFEAGNYKVRVETECGNSNGVTFSLKEWISATSLSPDAGPCGEWTSIRGDSFGKVQSKMFSDGYHGVHRMVDFVSSEGTYTALKYNDWTNRSFKVKFYRFFVDGMDAHGQRNFVRDDGSSDCTEEPLIAKCAGLPLGPWSVYVKAIYFGDDDASGNLSCADTIFQVVVSDPLSYELTDEPIIYRINPKQIERGNLLKILGFNFGPDQTDGQVRIGSQSQAQDPVLEQGKLLENISAWSSTRLEVKVKAPARWEGKTKCVWVEKDGKKSNYKKLEILEPKP